MSNQMIYNGECIHVRWSQQTWQNQSHYAKQGKMINQHNQHINVSNKYSNEAREKSPQSKSSIKIINHHNQHVHVPNEYNNQAYIQGYQELSMCNPVKQTHAQREVGTHWSTNQTPHLPHLKFKLDPLNNPQQSRHFVDPVFLLMCFHSMTWLAFYLFCENLIFFFKKTWSRHLFLFYF